MNPLDPNIRDLADAIWLARSLAGAPPAVPDSADTAGEQTVGTASRNRSSNEQRSEEGPTGSQAGERWQSTRASPPSGWPGAVREASGRAIAAQVSRDRALPHRDEISRALRPLRRSVVAKTGISVDEPATAQHLANAGTMPPVFRPLRERWLELAIVVDTGDTMQLWQETARAVRSLVEHHGAFRNVQTFRLNSDLGHARLLDDGGNQHHVQELPEHGGRRVILVLTDAVGPLWRSAAARAMLTAWTRHNPVAILNPLPASMWHRTALPPAQVVLRSAGPGRISRAGQGHDGAPWVPVLPLEPGPISGWARLLAGQETAGRPAHAVPVGWLPAAVSAAAPTDLLSRERVVRFQSTASPAAFTLAGRLAAAPLTLPLMRAIQNVLSPETELGHLAEILLSGLLVRVDDVQYDFLPGIREELLRTGSRGAAYSVLETLRDVATVVPNPYGALDVWALSAEPDRELVASPQGHRFAAVAITVLGGLGGQHAAMADRIDTALRDAAVALAASDAAVTVTIPGLGDVRQLCTDLRNQALRTDDELIALIQAAITWLRQFMPQRQPPEQVAAMLPLLGWLLYEASWEAVQRIPASLDHPAVDGPKRSQGERAMRHVVALADAARQLPWPEFAPRALGAIRAQALAESKRDTDAGHDNALVLHNESRTRLGQFRAVHGGDASRARLLLDLDEVELQLDLVELGSACRTTERVISRWAEDYATEAEDLWVRRMFDELTAALDVGVHALETTWRIKRVHGFVDGVTELRLTLPTALQNVGIMTARTALLLLALGPERDRIGPRPFDGKTRAAWEGGVLDTFEQAYRAIEEPDVDDEVPMWLSFQRHIAATRLNLALLKPGHSLPSRQPFDPSVVIDPLDSAAVSALSAWLAGPEGEHGRLRGIGSATMPSFIRSVVACRGLGPGDRGYQDWRLEWFRLDQYADEPRRRERVADLMARPAPTAAAIRGSGDWSLHGQRMIHVAEGRVLTVDVSGEPGGSPVFLLHGTPGSRKGPKPRSSVLYRLGVQLICYDRPGYGGSTRLAGRSVADAAADTAAIADDLAIERFSVVGRSGGGPHALACAALLPDRVNRTGVLLNGAVPTDASGLDWFDGVPRERAEHRDPEALADALRKRAARAIEDPEALIDLLSAEMSGPDRRIMQSMTYRRLLRTSYTEALEGGTYGWIDDVLAFRSDWGFALEQITGPVRLWSSTDETSSQTANIRWLTTRIRHAETYVESPSHFEGLQGMPDLIKWAAT